MVARNHLYLDGTLGAGNQERWSIGVAFSGLPGAPLTTATELQSWAEDVSDALGTATLTGMKNLLSSSGKITAVRTYYYPGPGPATATGATTLTSPVTGTGTISKPPQCAAVFTLLTGSAGRRNRGRFYWPWLSSGMNTDLTGTVPGGTATEAAALLNLMATLGSVGTVELTPAVYSRAGDTLTPVSSIRVGNIHDTQRRRRDKLVEVYQAANL